MAEYDAVIVGSGINSLVAAALLARAGWHVCVLEKNSWLGGAIQTAEITEPGFHHDVFSGWHPFFTGSEAYRLLKNDLGARGLEYLKTDIAAATLSPNGVSAFLHTLMIAMSRRWSALLLAMAKHGTASSRISPDRQI